MKAWKIILVIVGAIGITALGIDASDSISGSRFTLLASVFSAKTPTCPTGTVELKTETSLICVDKYEASVGTGCSVNQPSSAEDTAIDIKDSNCKPESVPDVLPWRYVTYHQAEQLCAMASKKLLTPAVWYQAALGTPDNKDCNTAGDIALTGKFASCQSGIGAQDMIGNVWELVSSDINNNGELYGLKLPEEGYVNSVNNDGIATETTTTPNVNFQADYFWSNTNNDRVIMRGGFYGGKSDAGLYSTHTGIGSNFSSGAIGFRCMIVK